MNEIDVDRGICVAAQCGDVQLLNQFRQAGADVNCRIDGATPLISAVSNKEPLAVQELIKAGADLDADDGAAVAIAITKQDVRILKYLIDGGAKIKGKEHELLSRALSHVAGSPSEWHVQRASEIADIVLQAAIRDLSPAKTGELKETSDFSQISPHVG